MSTNPDNAIGTNGAYSGRTSVNAFNDCISSYSQGILSGWSCVVSSGLTVSLGGVNGTRDVAIATDNNGNNTTINNISESPVNVTISSAPATDSRVDSIVAYVDNPPTGVSTTADNPGACGLIVVKGTVASSPIAPDDSAIRTAITADGASGTTAYYVVLANVTIASGTTDLDDSMITQGVNATMSGSLIAGESITGDKLDWDTMGSGWNEGASTSYYRRTRWTTIYDYFKPGPVSLSGQTSSGTYTTPAGNQYGFIVVNYRTGGAVTSGAGNISHARGGSLYRPTTPRDCGLAVRGISGSSNTYFDCTGGYDIATSSVIAPYRYTATSSGMPYSGKIPIGSANNQNTMTVTWEAVRAVTSNWWHIRGTIYAQKTVVNFVISANAADSNTIPGLYFTGTAENLPAMAGTWFEISEPMND